MSDKLHPLGATAQSRKQATALVATLKCVGCSHQWTLRDPVVAAGDHPMCPHCLMPGILLKAERRTVK